MSDVKISQLPSATTPLAGTELVPLVQGGVTKQVAVSNLGGGGGGVTAVTATAPVVSSGGTTPVISIAAATASVNGYLTSTDWNTFNNKQPAGSYLTSGGALGTPSSGTATNLTGLPLTTGVTGILPVANGGSGTATPSLVAGTNVTITGTWPNQTINSSGGGGGMTYPGAGIANSTGSAWGTSYTTTGSGTVLALANSPSLTTPILGTPQSGNFSTGTFTWPTFNQNTTGTAANITASSNSTLTTLSSLSLPGSQVSGNISGNAANVTGVVAVANGGTGVTTSSGANSVVLRDANNNITANAYFNGFTSVAASGSTITLTVASTPVYLITGSGGQVVQLPNATTLSNGTIFSFNNNQSSGAITVNNASGSLIASIPSGAYVTIVLLSNATSAGTWDRHDQTPANVSWSTNTLDYSGSISSATWNGTAIAINRGGTNGTATPTAGGAAYGTGTAYAFTSAGTSGQVLTSNGASAPTWQTPSGISTGKSIAMAMIFGF